MKTLNDNLLKEFNEIINEYNDKLIKDDVDINIVTYIYKELIKDGDESDYEKKARTIINTAIDKVKIKYDYH